MYTAAGKGLHHATARRRDCTKGICTNATGRVFFAHLPVPHPIPLLAACRNLAGSPDDRTVATAILKTLPEYPRLQKLVNQSLIQKLPIFEQLRNILFGNKTNVPAGQCLDF